MHPVLVQLEVGGTILTLFAYGTFLALAATAAGVLFVHGAGALGLGRRRAAVLFLVALAAGLAGARMLDLAMNPAVYAADPARLLAAEPRGFGLYGGLAGAALVALAWSRQAGIPLRRLADATIPAVAAGIVLLRIGCFLNGCCDGVATDLPWGVVFPPRAVGLERDLLEGQIPLFGTVMVPAAVHPTQLYELTTTLALALAARLVARRGAPAGVPALIFAAGFLLFRSANQLLRPTPPDALLSQTVLIGAYATAALVAAVWLVRVAAPALRAPAAQAPAAASSST
jgi:phosphatidylglycerol:prolipoprotein diacylglycerol transferase